MHEPCHVATVLVKKVDYHTFSHRHVYFGYPKSSWTIPRISPISLIKCVLISRKSCINFPSASSHMVINYHQLEIKLRLYTAIVIPTAMYAYETWKRTAMIAHRLDVFHRRCLRTILGISWRDHVTNEEVLRRAGTERLQDIVTTRRR